MIQQIMNKKFALLSIAVVVVSLILPDYSIKIIGSILKNSLFPNKRFSKPVENVFTINELKSYNGIEKPELYLSILGKVFDVTKGAKHYGPNQQYNVFVGRDASRNFVTGKFSPEDISDDVSGLTKDELRSLNHWVKFYSKEYKLVGKLIGRYFDESGKNTEYGIKINELIVNAEKEKENEKELNEKYPPCNVEWDAEKGTRFWCSTKSGGISRNWDGFPRQLYDIKTKQYRCACINEKLVNKLGNIKEYNNCDKLSKSCFV